MHDDSPNSYLYYATPRRLTERELRFLDLLTRQAADLIERRQVETALQTATAEAQQQAQEAEAANRIKDEFLAVVSHELRSPLNPILGWSKLLQQGKLDATRTTSALDTIERNAQLQAQLINDLLDISRILRGKLSLEQTPIDLSVVITSALETVRLAAEAKGIEVRREERGERSVVRGVWSAECGVRSEESEPLSLLTPHPSPLLVLGDAGRLQQVIWNLLSNAVKFTPAGGRVEIWLEQVEDRGVEGVEGVEGARGQGVKGARGQGEEDEEETQNSELKTQNSKLKTFTPHPTPHTPHPPSYAQITITDTGKGIKREFLPYVFEHFRQEDGATTRRFGGLGLGLAIARQLVELHGGQISVDSPGEGQGATFTVRLPQLREQGDGEVGRWGDGEMGKTLRTPHSAPRTPLAGLKILVVDDDPDSRDFIAFVLEQAGAIATPVASGIEVLQLVEQSLPDLIVSDIGMPVMDGYMLLQHLRERLPASQLPAIALTAYAGEFDRQQALRAGFQCHLAKPVEPAEVVITVARLCGRKEEDA